MPYFVAHSSSGIEKYLLAKNGEKVDLREHFKAQRALRESEFGKLSPQFLKKLDSLGNSDTLRVSIRFKAREKISPDGTLSNEHAVRLRLEAFEKGISRLESVRGTRPMPFGTFTGRAQAIGFLSKREILALKHEESIDGIVLADFNATLMHPLAGLAANYNGISTGGLNLSPVCTGNCGSGVQVGLIEPTPIDSFIQGMYFGSPWFNMRPGKSLWKQQDWFLHGAWSGGMIRNVTGPNIGNWEFGGAPALSKLHYSSGMEGDGPDDMLHWPVDAGARITNHSYGLRRYEGEWIAGWHHDWHVDNIMASYPYPFAVAAAGNTGQINDNGSNDLCVNRSNGFGTPWTPEECQRVGWWGHNVLIVGSVDNPTTRSPFSAFRDGPTGNEAPQVVTRGSDVELPWMAPYDSPTGYCVYGGSGVGKLCGTSIAAPAVTSMAAGLMSRFSNLNGFPEAMKAIIIASATPLVVGNRWNSFSSDDWETGAGIPDGGQAVAIASNKKTGASFSSGRWGYTTFVIPSQTPNGAQFTRNITLTPLGSGYIQWWLVWVSPPHSLANGDTYYPDDLDLQVTTGGIGHFSVSVANSIEHVTTSSQSSYTVTTTLYNRNTNWDSDIRVALVWAKTSSY